MVISLKQYISLLQIFKISVIISFICISCNRTDIIESLSQDFYNKWRDSCLENTNINLINSSYYKKRLNNICDSLRVNSINIWRDNYHDHLEKFYTFEVFEIYNENSGYYNFYLRVNESDSVLQVKSYLYDRSAEILNIKMPYVFLGDKLCLDDESIKNFVTTHEYSIIYIYSKFEVKSYRINIDTICIDFE